MRIVKPEVTLLHVTPFPDTLIEKAGRTCYKSVPKGDSDSFVRMINKRGHESVIEHAVATFHIVTDRGISHEIVRHRLASYSQESTRYCNYSKGKFDSEITVVCPSGLDHDQYMAWVEACYKAEESYMKLLALGATPQQARSVLPTCLKTELVMTANFREWAHFIKMRGAKDAHPDVRIIAEGVWTRLVGVSPAVFDKYEELFQ